MSWEQRGSAKHRYYYRARKINGKVIKHCLGRGVPARLAARQDAKRRAIREAERAAILAERQQMTEPELIMDELDQTSTLLLEATLLGGNYHRHNYGVWRKRRNGIDGNEPGTAGGGLGVAGAREAG